MVLVILLENDVLKQPIYIDNYIFLCEDILPPEVYKYLS